MTRFPILLPFLLLLLYLVVHSQDVRTPNGMELAPGVRTSSLSDTFATDGDNKTNAEIFHLLTLVIFRGFAIFKIKQYNDRAYLEKFRRSYWFGNRYYYLDNKYYLSTRDTCAYRLDDRQKKDLMYEDDYPINDIIYQCQRYVEYCCGLDCCRLYDLYKPLSPHQQQQYPWSAGQCSPSASALTLLALFILLRAASIIGRFATYMCTFP